MFDLFAMKRKILLFAFFTAQIIAKKDAKNVMNTYILLLRIKMQNTYFFICFQFSEKHL